MLFLGISSYHPTSKSPISLPWWVESKGIDQDLGSWKAELELMEYKAGPETRDSESLVKPDVRRGPIWEENWDQKQRVNNKN